MCCLHVLFFNQKEMLVAQSGNLHLGEKIIFWKHIFDCKQFHEIMIMET